MRHIISQLFIAAIGLSMALPSAGLAQTHTAVSADTLNGKIRVLPNPWSASIHSGHFAGRTGNPVADSQSGYSRVLFINIPSYCTIKIYTVDGHLVKTIVHDSNPGTNSNSTTWNMISDSDQYVVSGVYVWVVQTTGTRDYPLDEQTEVGKMIIIR